VSCQQVPAAPAFISCPRSTQVGEFEVAITGGIWVAFGDAIQESPIAKQIGEQIDAIAKHRGTG